MVLSFLWQVLHLRCNNMRPCKPKFKVTACKMLQLQVEGILIMSSFLVLYQCGFVCKDPIAVVAECHCLLLSFLLFPDHSAGSHDVSVAPAAGKALGSCWTAGMAVSVSLLADRHQNSAIRKLSPLNSFKQPSGSSMAYKTVIAFRCLIKIFLGFAVRTSWFAHHPFQAARRLLHCESRRTKHLFLSDPDSQQCDAMQSCSQSLQQLVGASECLAPKQCTCA